MIYMISLDEYSDYDTQLERVNIAAFTDQEECNKQLERLNELRKDYYQVLDDDRDHSQWIGNSEGSRLYSCQTINVNDIGKIDIEMDDIKKKIRNYINNKIKCLERETKEKELEDEKKRIDQEIKNLYI